MNTQLWQKIQQFQFDPIVTDYGFTTRLAYENNWTLNFTQEAIDEYKKFMYLAATAQTMVSPSEIVDIVWHQHLIFTQSYHDFCNLLGKKIEHIPSTHHSLEKEKFDNAKQLTLELYEKEFQQKAPSLFWNFKNPNDSLLLEKSDNNLLISFFKYTFIALFLYIPLIWLLKPLIISIDNPYYLIYFSVFALLAFVMLYAYNENKIKLICNQIIDNEILRKLNPLELIYMENGRNGIIHSLINKMIKKDWILIVNDRLQVNKSYDEHNAMEFTIFETIKKKKEVKYQDLINELNYKPVFLQVKNSIEAIKSIISSSKVFVKLFSLNLIVMLAFLFFLIIRLYTGLEREKPVGFLIFMLFVFIIISLFSLILLYRSIKNQIIKSHKTVERKQNASTLNDDWQYFLLGSVIFLPEFKRIYADYQSSGGEGGSGSDGGSSCGGGCGGCGGSN